MKMKVVGILRESSKEQAKKDRKGLQDQEEEILKFATESGMEVAFWETVVESASHWDRPIWESEIEEVIKHYGRGEVGGIIFDRVDRETRNLFASIPILNRALRAGLRVFFAKERFELDPKDPEVERRYLDKAIRAIGYREVVSESWKTVHHRRAGKGLHPTNQRLFTFCYEDKKRVLDEAVVPFALEAINLFLRDKQLSPVVRWLWSKDFTVLNSASALRRWLQNPALKGETNACGEVIHHDALISSTEWDEVQAILKENSPRPSRKGYLPIPFICGCGTRMKADRHKRKTIAPRIYVHCPCCHKPNYRLDRLLPMVSLATLVYIGDKHDFMNDSVVKAELRERVLADLQDVEKAQARLKNEWRSLLDGLVEKEWKGPKAILDEKQQSLASQEAALEEKESRLLAELKDLPEIQVIDIKKAWEDAIAPYEVHFTRLRSTPPTLDFAHPEDHALKLLQGPPSSFYKINNMKPFYLDPIYLDPSGPEGCIVPEPLTTDADIVSVWDSGRFQPSEQLKSAVRLDSWVWNLLRDLRAEAFLDQGRFKLRFNLRVNPRRPNKTPWYTSPCSRPAIRLFPEECGLCSPLRWRTRQPKGISPGRYPA